MPGWSPAQSPALSCPCNRLCLSEHRLRQRTHTKKSRLNQASSSRAKASSSLAAALSARACARSCSSGMRLSASACSVSSSYCAAAHGAVRGHVNQAHLTHTGSSHPQHCLRAGVQPGLEALQRCCCWGSRLRPGICAVSSEVCWTRLHHITGSWHSVVPGSLLSTALGLTPG